MNSFSLLFTAFCIAGSIYAADEQNILEQNHPLKTLEKPAGKPLEIHYSLKPDGREWNLLSKTDSDHLTILQYIPDATGEPEEILTVVYMKDYTNSPAEYFDIYLKQLKALAPKSTLASKKIKQDKDSFFGEWWIADKSPQDVHEWVRIFSDGKQSFAIIKISTTKMDEIEKARSKWEEIIGQASYH